MSQLPPLPIAPLSYDMSPRHGRPGLVTAMGVMSVILACVGGIAGLISLFLSFGMIMAATASRQLASMPMPTIVPPTAPSYPATAPGAVDGGDAAATPSGVVTIGGIEVSAPDSEDALSEPQRRVVLTTLTRIRALDEARQKHLELLLSVAGRRVMPIATSPGLTMQKVRANITEHGTLPSARGGAGPDYFLVGTGRLECYDDHAVFRPDGSTDVVSASATAQSTDDSAADDGTGSSSSARSGVSPGRFSFRRGPTTTWSGPVIQISPAAAGAMLITQAAGVALAIYLLVIGILVLRDVRAGWKLHWWYVALKIPLVIVSLAASWYVWQGFRTSINTFLAANPPPGAARPPPVPLGGIMGGWLTFFAALALAYPIALIFVLNSRTVRDYYGSVRE
jgi:hypothetical protein